MNFVKRFLIEEETKSEFRALKKIKALKKIIILLLPILNLSVKL